MDRPTIEQAFQHHQAGRLTQAEQLYRKILAQHPNHAMALQHLGVIAYQVGRHDAAAELIRAAIALNPNYAEAYCNLGNALKDRGRFDEAIPAYRHAIALQPRFAEAHCNLGSALKDIGHLDEAIAAYRKAIAINPDFAEAHANLGIALNEKGQFDESIAACRAAIAVQPNCAQAYNNLAFAFQNKGQIDAAILSYRQAITLKPGYFKAHSNLLLAMNYHDGYDPQTIAEEHRSWGRLHAELLGRSIQGHANDRNPDRRLRIGYVSPDMKGHSVGRFLLPLLAHHDRSQFEIIAYAQVPVSDAMTELLQTHADRWRNTVGLSDVDVADLIQRDQVDVLVDLAGHTAGNRLMVFARKPAPVQVTYLGYPNTTGLSVMDYRLTDGYADPPGLSDTLNSEQLIRLPQTNWIYQHPEDGPAFDRRPSKGAIVFGCFNNIAKVTDAMFTIWAKILLATPGSRLLLKAKGLDDHDLRRRFVELMIKQGIDSGRLELYGYEVGYAAHLAFYNRIDIALDPFPYHGTTTTCEALWMGLPVITLTGQTHVSRVGVSLLTNVGLAELIARNPEEYQKIAMELAGDVPRLSDLRATLRRRMEKSPLMDAPKFARGVETAYRQMWLDWCAAASR